MEARMSFDLDAVRARLFEEVRQAVVTAHPDTLVAYENQKFTEPAATPWVYVWLTPGNTERSDIGSSRRVHNWGVVTIMVTVPEDGGTRKLRQLESTLINALMDKNISLGPAGNLSLWGGRGRFSGLQQGKYASRVIFDYRYRAVLT
jgi:hypothetical protein